MQQLIAQIVADQDKQRQAQAKVGMLKGAVPVKVTEVRVSSCMIVVRLSSCMTEVGLSSCMIVFRLSSSMTEVRLSSCMTEVHLSSCMAVVRLSSCMIPSPLLASIHRN